MNSSNPYDQVGVESGGIPASQIVAVVLPLAVMYYSVKYGQTDDKNENKKVKSVSSVLNASVDFFLGFLYLCVITFSFNTYVLQNKQDSSCNIFIVASVTNLNNLTGSFDYDAQYRLNNCNAFVMCQNNECSFANGVSSNGTLIQDSWLQDEICEDLNNYYYKDYPTDGLPVLESSVGSNYLITMWITMLSYHFLAIMLKVFRAFAIENDVANDEVIMSVVGKSEIRNKIRQLVIDMALRLWLLPLTLMHAVSNKHAGCDTFYGNAVSLGDKILYVYLGCLIYMVAGMIVVLIFQFCGISCLKHLAYHGIIDEDMDGKYVEKFSTFLFLMPIYMFFFGVMFTIAIQTLFVFPGYTLENAWSLICFGVNISAFHYTNYLSKKDLGSICFFILQLFQLLTVLEKCICIAFTWYHGYRETNADENCIELPKTNASASTTISSSSVTSAIHQ